MSGGHQHGPITLATGTHAEVTKHADTSQHKTQKSFKTDRRDKPKHSGKNISGPKKGGGGGKGTWGRPGDESKDTPLEPDDPNYDPDEMEGGYDWAPSDSTQIKFASSLEDFGKFKSAIKSAAKEYLQSNDAAEFQRIVRALSMTVFHQDLPYILIRYSLDLNDSERSRISSLLANLHKAGFITVSQMGAGVRKLYNSLSDLLVDVPNARTLLREHVSFAVAGGFLDAGLAKQLEEEQEQLADHKHVDELKAKIKAAVTEFWTSEDLPDTVKTIKELNAPFLNFEVVKQLVSQSLDRGNRQREGASVFLSNSEGLLQQSDIEKGFTILLERVDDMSLDVPEVLKLLSIFVARAVVDEALPPAFLVRVDLNANDLGSRVLQQAQELLKQPNASDFLAYCWESLQDEVDAKNASQSQTQHPVGQPAGGSNVAAQKPQ